jgi:hypothetical protein
MRLPWSTLRRAIRFADPAKEVELQETIKQLLFAIAKPGSVEFDDLLDKILEHEPELAASLPKPFEASEVEDNEPPSKLG